MSYHPNCTISGPDNFGRKWKRRVSGSESVLLRFHSGSALQATSGMTGTDARRAARAAFLSARACVKLARMKGLI